MQHRKNKRNWIGARLIVGSCAGWLAAGATPVAAVEISAGEWTGSIDTTLSWGVASRVEDRDADLVGIANGGNALSVNGDDGNLNYDTGIFSNAFKVTSEMLLERGDYGGFLRVTAFYDFEANDGDTERTPLSDDAKDVVGSDAKVLDAYVWSSFDIGERPAQVRFGNQVLSWGESTFIQNSINTINPVDVSALRIPGSELREALIPVTMLSGSMGVTDDGTLEAFIQLDWKKTEIDPTGTYFSTNDFAGPGGNRVQFGFGGVPEDDFLSVSRAEDRDPDDSGQFGLAYRWFMPELNDTEFGVYFIQYHSRLPIISAHTGTQAGVDAVPPGTSSTDSALDTDAYARTANYYLEYPEEIQLLGLSLNTTVGDYAVQGEYSFRKDVPLQIDDIELLFAALTPNSPALAANQLSQYLNDGAAYAVDTDIPGYIQRDVSQIQATITRLVPQVLGASQLTLVGEVGVTHVHDMPAKRDLRLEAPGTYISGNQALASAHSPTAAGEYEAADRFADATSWGYRVVGRLEYLNAIGAANLAPRIAWAEDVSGNSPGPGGNFLEGRTALTLGLGLTYLGGWAGDISYTRYDGADRYNLINDRDFVAFNIKYSF